MGGVIVLLGRLVGAAQRVVPGVQDKERPLTEAERALLEEVFGDSVALGDVRVVPGRSGLFGVNARPFTLGNTVYLKGRGDPGVLVHECAHVWQYQHHGPRYAADALFAQAFVDDPYNWAKEIERGKTAWTAFNAEAQAAFVEDAWAGRVEDGELAEQALTTLRRARP